MNVTIILDKQQGKHSNGLFTAWPRVPADIIPEVLDDDERIAKHFWDNWREDDTPGKLLVGVGNTPNEAYNQLLEKLKV